MEKYIELFAEACDHHMRLENERVQRERQLEIENLQAARVQCEQLRLALLEEAEPNQTYEVNGMILTIKEKKPEKIKLKYD
jgi:hypothetical protein